MDWLVRFVFVNVGQHGIDGFDALLAFFHAPHDGNGGIADFIQPGVKALHGGDFLVGDAAGLLELADASLVFLDGDLGGGNLLAQGLIGRVGSHTPLRVVEPANFGIRLADSGLFGGVVDVEPANFCQLPGFGHARLRKLRTHLGQVGGPFLQIIQKVHSEILLSF